MKTILVSLLIIILIPQVFPVDFKFGAFDPSCWSGLVIVKDDIPYSFRFIFEKDGKIADGYDTFYLAPRVGPFSPGGTYGRISFNTALPFNQKKKTPVPKISSSLSGYLNIEYSRIDSGVLGKITIPKGISVKIRFYSPWGKVINYNFSDKGVSAGKEEDFYFSPVDFKLTFKIKTETYLDVSIKKGTEKFYFFAGFKKQKLSIGKIDQIIKKRAEEYKSKKPEIFGEWEGIISSIINNISWMRLYQPDKKRVYIPAGRRWIFPGPDGKKDLWTIFEWDAFFNAVLASVYDEKLAADEIDAVIDTQYPWGNIPNWKTNRGGTPDRSQPPIGAFSVYKVYLKTNNKEIIRSSYNALKKWHMFWISELESGNIRRDGNLDGLLEWGSDKDKLFSGMPKWEIGASGRQKAAWESGEDDLPNYDNVPFDEKKGTLKMNCIDLSSLYLLDAEILGKMALILDLKEDAEYFSKKVKILKDKINRIMWDRSFYFDRFWDGKFSTQKAASNFYPMIAGAPDKERTEKIITHLLSVNEFWGQFIIPTISRDNPAFKDQQYWRGTIWPPTNYLVYHGLKRYGYDEIAAEFAVKSATLFNNSWKDLGLCRENYNSITGEGGGHRYQSWGPLFALILLEDFIDISPFHGLSISNLSASKENNFKNIKLQGHIYDLKANKNMMFLKRDKINIIKIFGRAVLGEIKIEKKSLSFDINVISENAEIFPLMFKSDKYHMELDGKKYLDQRIRKGKYKIKIKEEK